MQNKPSAGSYQFQCDDLNMYTVPKRKANRLFKTTHDEVAMMTSTRGALIEVKQHSSLQLAMHCAVAMPREEHILHICSSESGP